jgi:hypothetical protein
VSLPELKDKTAATISHSGFRFIQCVRRAGLCEKMNMQDTINTTNAADAE